MKWTKEQTTLFEYFKNNKNVNIRVLAYAGAGKTHALTEMAKVRPNERGLYLAFNRALAEEAKEKFPDNVKTMTVHSLAFSYMKPTLANSPKHFVEHMAEHLDADIFGLWMAYFTLQKFCQSADTVVKKKHFMCDKNRDKYTPKVLDKLAPRIVKLANQVWNTCSATLDFPVLHDHYLKQFSMLPLVELQRFDYVFFDEAQDANPVMLVILKKMEGVQKVIVGDSYQQIYEFTGAINSLDTFKDFKTFFLSQSFRWGEEIGEFATHLLSPLRKEDPDVKGTPAVSTEVRFGVPSAELKESLYLDMSVILCRTNFKAIETGLSLTRLGIAASIVDGYKILVELKKLESFKEGDISKYKGYRDWSELLKDANDDPMNVDTAWLIKLVEVTPPHDMEEVKVFLSNRDTGIPIYTGHKAKGLEWDNVYLEDDFNALNESEIRLLYVAATRARKNLYVASSLQRFKDDLRFKGSEIHVKQERRKVAKWLGLIDPKSFKEEMLTPKQALQYEERISPFCLSEEAEEYFGGPDSGGFDPGDTTLITLADYERKK